MQEYDPEIDPEQEEDLINDREKLLEERRNRQMGNSKPNEFRKYAIAGAAAFGAIGLYFLFKGTLEDKSFDSSQTASQVNLDIERAKGSPHQPSMDFNVPAAPEKEIEKVENPETELEKKFSELQSQLAEISEDSKMSKEQVEGLLNQYNEKMALELENQRSELLKENERLSNEAEKLKAEAELKASNKIDAEKAAEISRAQNSSGSVLLDESAATLMPGSENIESEQNDIAQLTTEKSQDQKFLAEAASSTFETSVSQQISDPSKTVVQGAIISGVLETAINTELPGNIRAQVTEPVFAFDGSNNLIPAGTTLIGTFNPDISVAQKRVLIAWNRAITPEGQSIALGSTGTDELGRSGTQGNVDGRFMQKFGAAALITTITAIPSAIAGVTSSASSSSGTSISIGGQVASGGSSAVAAASNDILNEHLALAPIIRIPQGQEIRVFVNRDLVFK